MWVSVGAIWIQELGIKRVSEQPFQRQIALIAQLKA